MGPLCRPLLRSGVNYSKKKFISRSDINEMYIRCSMQSTWMEKIYIQKCLFRECHMDKSVWEKCDIDDLVIDRCYAPGITLDKCNVSGLRMYESEVNKLSMVDCKVTKSRIAKVLSSKNLGVARSILESVVFLDLDIRGSSFISCTLRNVIFNNVDMTYCYFYKTTFENCVFINTPMTDCLLGMCSGIEPCKFVHCKPSFVRADTNNTYAPAVRSLIINFRERVLYNDTDFINKSEMVKSSKLYIDEENSKSLSKICDATHKNLLEEKKIHLACGYDRREEVPKNRAYLFLSPGLKQRNVVDGSKMP